MLRETVFWTKIGRIITRLSERLDITPETAFELFCFTKARLAAACMNRKQNFICLEICSL